LFSDITAIRELKSSSDSVFIVMFLVVNPADGNVIGNVPDMVGDDVNHAVEAAYSAFQTWKLTTAKVLLHGILHCLVKIIPAEHFRTNNTILWQMI